MFLTLWNNFKTWGDVATSKTDHLKLILVYFSHFSDKLACLCTFCNQNMQPVHQGLI